MKPLQIASATCLIALLGAAIPGADAQIAGTTSIDVATIDYEAALVGWSARKQIIGHDVYNESGEKVGKVEDLIVTPQRAASFAIVGAGGFIGLHRHHVAIPVALLSPRGGDFVLSGATKAAIKALPAFQYEE